MRAVPAGRGGRRQQEVIPGEGDDVEGVLLPVDGLEERLVREPGHVRLVQTHLAARTRSWRRRRLVTGRRWCSLAGTGFPK